MPNTPSADDLARHRADGAEAAARLADQQAPVGRLERLAWLAGAGSVDAVPDAVAACRAAGLTWAQIAAALGANTNTTKTRYGAGYPAQRRYRARRRGEG